MANPPSEDSVRAALKKLRQLPLHELWVWLAAFHVEQPFPDQSTLLRLVRDEINVRLAADGKQQLDG